MPIPRFPVLVLSVPAPLAHALAPVPAPSHVLFDTGIRRIVADAGVPGAAYAIVVDGKVEAARGIGVRALGGSDPVGPDTFRIASVSKTFTAELATMLADEGRLDWNMPLSRFAPDFRLKNGAERRIQLRHVMSQSSGLVPNAFDNLVDADQPLARTLPQFRTLMPTCAPGQCYGYQNILYAQSVHAIEQAAGRDYGELLARRVFVPLGMHAASVGMPAFLAATDRAMPHIERDGRWERIEVEPNYYQLPAAAGVNASADDLATWLIAQMGGRLDVVPVSDVEWLTKPRVTTPKDMRRGRWKDMLASAHYGLGWRIYRIGDEPIVLHAGWVEGYVAEISYSPRRHTGLVLLMNGENGAALNDAGAGFWRRELDVPEVAIEPATPRNAASIARPVVPADHGSRGGGMR